MGTEQTFFMGKSDERKKEFLICRVERDIFLKLKERANQQGISFSDVIREGCKEILLKNG